MLPLHLPLFIISLNKNNNITMKKHLTTFMLLITATFSFAQAVNDSVFLGAQYANQVWYSLANDEQGTSAKNNWDIAFEINSITSSILLNSANGNTLWVYPNSDINGWNAIDTTGITTWPKLYNSDLAWEMGAFNVNIDPFDAADLGWGVYNTSNHQVVGDSLYIIKLSNGAYKKLWIEKLANSVYTFKYGNLDNTGEETKTIAKADFTGKNFGYFSIQNGAQVNREPLAANWDLTFTQYTAFVPVAYTVSGVLTNKTTGVVKVYPVNDPSTYKDYASQTFGDKINTLGWAWKTYNMTLGAYIIEDSTVYFIKDGNDDVWKLIFTGFASNNGKFVFSKEKLTSSVGINAPLKNNFFTLYPNPASAGTVSIVMDMAADATVNIMDMSGKVLNTQTLQGNGLSAHTLSTQGLANGLYMVQVAMGNKVFTQKLAINQ
jgi:hypothetical protein